MITPSSNTAIEPMTTRIFATLGEAVTVHFTLDLLEACRRLGITRCGLATPYLPEVHEAIRRTLAAEGLEVVASASLGIAVNHEFAEVPLLRIEALLAEVAVPAADGIAVV